MLKECPKVGDVIACPDSQSPFHYEILWAKPSPLAGEFYAVTARNGEIAFDKGLKFALWSLVKPKIVQYVNIYPGSAKHETREIADRAAGNMERTGCIRVEFEESQFDD